LSLHVGKKLLFQNAERLSQRKNATVENLQRRHEYLGTDYNVGAQVSIP